MKKAAVLMARGFEEGETVTIIDILRRAGIACDSFSFGEAFVTGMHGMQVKADKAFGPAIEGYDMVILPGGRPGGDNLRGNPAVLDLIRKFDAEGKFVAAMCSGTVALSDAGIIAGRRVTGYVGYEKKLAGGIFEEKVVVRDGNLITSQGPATPYPFAYALAEALGADTSVLRERMLYNFAGGR